MNQANVPEYLRHRPNRDAWLAYKTVGEQSAARMGFHVGVAVTDTKAIRCLAYWYGLEHVRSPEMGKRLENAFLSGAGLQP